MTTRLLALVLILSLASTASAQFGFQPQPFYTYGPPAIYPYGGLGFSRYSFGFSPYNFGYSPYLYGLGYGLGGGYVGGYGSLPPNPPSPYYTAPSGGAYLQGARQRDAHNAAEMLIRHDLQQQQPGFAGPPPTVPSSSYRAW